MVLLVPPNPLMLIFLLGKGNSVPIQPSLTVSTVVLECSIVANLGFTTT